MSNNLDELIQRSNAALKRRTRVEQEIVRLNERKNMAQKQLKDLRDKADKLYGTHDLSKLGELYKSKVKEMSNSLLNAEKSLDIVESALKEQGLL